MKSNFDRRTNYIKINYQTQRENLSLSSNSLDLASLSNLDIQNLERCLRTCIKEKASQGNYTVAIAILDRLIALNPDNAADYNNRGLMYFRNNQITEALCDLSQALLIDPCLDSAYNNRANCHAAEGNLIEAIADYDLALDLNPANLHAWIDRGITLRELESYDLAIENFEITLIIGNALEERIYAERGRTYHLRGDWNCAVGDYQKALNILKTKPQSAKYRQQVMGWLDELIAPLLIGDRRSNSTNCDR